MYPLLNRLLHRLLARRHFWRQVGFSELAELYASRMLRTAAVSMVSVFVAVYLYQIGYSVLFITLFFAGYFLYRGLVCFPAAHLIGRVGPKHGVLISNLLYVPALLALAFVPAFGLPMLIVYGAFQAFSMSLYNISYHADFSKVKHAEHAGKEIGFTQMVDRFGAMLSPLFAGAAAFAFGPQAVILAASAVFAVAAVPLFITPEPLQIHQRVRVGRTLRRYGWRHFLGYVGLGSNHAASMFVWPLFLALIIFTGGGDIIYAQIGAVTSIGVLAGFVAIHVYGRLIDRARGRELLEVSTIGTSLLHLGRLTVATPAGAIAFNIANEAAMIGYNMPFAKGMYDTADNEETHRIGYLAFAEYVSAGGAAVLMLLGAAAIWFFGDAVMGVQAQYVAAALLGLLLLTQRFKTYGG